MAGLWPQTGILTGLCGDMEFPTKIYTVFGMASMSLRLYLWLGCFWARRRGTRRGTRGGMRRDAAAACCWGCLLNLCQNGA